MLKERFLAEAEMFSKARTHGWSRKSMAYRRFGSLALAVKYAMEDMSDVNGVVIRTGDDDFSGKEIKGLYDSASFPLTRKGLRAAP